MNNLLTNNHRGVADRLYRAFAAGDLDTLLAQLSDDVVLDVPGDHPNAGRWEGRAGFAEFLVASSAVAREQLEVLDVLVGDTHAAAYVVVRGERDGRAPLVNHTLHVFELDGDGRVSSLRFHNADQRAVDAFWR